ncbi:hypothetical protein BDZ97DRAFT_1916830 [Flammula alnicola]|nr:hypothetical protein BDZ97DRAFT_1916830 [Flammula alnicola]
MHILRHLAFGTLASSGFAILRSEASPIEGSWDDTDTTTVPLPTEFPLSMPIAARSTTSDVVHDNLFIPAIVTMGIVFLLALVCWYNLGCCCDREKRERRDAPPNWPPRGYRVPDMSVTGSDNLQPRPLSSQISGQEQPGSPNTLGRRISKVQRKPAPPFVPSAPGTPPTTPGMIQTSGIPQYGFQPVDPRVPMTVTPSNIAASNTNQAYWTRDGLRMSSLSPGQSWTQVGSGSEQQWPSQYHSTNPYAATGYAATPPLHPQAPPPEFGAHYPAGVHGSQASDPYGGIDRQYERDQRWSDGRDDAAGDTGRNAVGASSSSPPPPLYLDNKNYAGAPFPEKAPRKVER